MSIELLTTSAGDYARSQGKELTDYTMRGFSKTEGSQWEAKRELKDSAKESRCVVVVDLQYSVVPGMPATFLNLRVDPEYTVAGTGLIPSRPRSLDSID